ncbi:MAG TPA: hypothetical protein VGR91_05980 [Stellaceae bacterium]|nr:hypothetical protein [Stellaceae bacterium]
MRPANGREAGRDANAESKRGGSRWWYIGGFTAPCCTALAALILNIVVAVVLTPVFDAAGASCGSDETAAEHYV